MRIVLQSTIHGATFIIVDDRGNEIASNGYTFDPTDIAQRSFAATEIALRFLDIL